MTGPIPIKKTVFVNLGKIHTRAASLADCSDSVKTYRSPFENLDERVSEITFIDRSC